MIGTKVSPHVIGTYTGTVGYGSNGGGLAKPTGSAPSYNAPTRGGMLSSYAGTGQAMSPQQASATVSGSFAPSYSASVGYTPQSAAPVQVPNVEPKPWMPPVAPDLPPAGNATAWEPLPDIPGLPNPRGNTGGPTPLPEMIGQPAPMPELHLPYLERRNLAGPRPLNSGFMPLTVNPYSSPYTSPAVNPMFQPTAFNGLGQASTSGQVQTQGMLSQLLMALRANAGF